MCDWLVKPWEKTEFEKHVCWSVLSLISWYMIHRCEHLYPLSAVLPLSKYVHLFNAFLPVSQIWIECGTWGERKESMLVSGCRYLAPGWTGRMERKGKCKGSLWSLSPLWWMTLFSVMTLLFSVELSFPPAMVICNVSDHWCYYHALLRSPMMVSISWQYITFKLRSVHCSSQT